LSNTGAVTRSSSHVELTLTGTFTHATDDDVFATKNWRVRVMRTNAALDEFLNVHYKIDGGVLKNVAWSGEYYVPSLGGDATIQARGNYNYINVGANGYIDLGEKIGALMRKPEWTIEFLAYIPSDSGTIFGIANRHPSTTGSGSIVLHNAALRLKAITSGTTGAASNTAESTNDASRTGGSLGLQNFSGNSAQWVHLGIIRRPDSYVTGYTNSGAGAASGTMRIIRNWGRAQNDRHIDFRKISTNANFGSVNDETYPMPYAYLGRGMFTGVNADLNNGTPNGLYYEIKVWSKAVHLGDDAYDNQAELRAVKGQMNSDFGYPNTN
jgi:hypothetical protein